VRRARAAEIVDAMPELRLSGCGLVSALITAACALFATPSLASPGELDTGFGTNGIAITTLNGGGFWNGITVLPGGSIVATGLERSYGRAAARVDAHGAPDLSFNGDGIATMSDSNAYSPADSGVDSQGRTVLLDTVGTDSFAVRRLTSAGAPDSTFAGGQATITFSGYTGVHAGALLVDPNDRVVVVGTGTPGNATAPVGLIARLTGTGANAGTPDTSFNGTGRNETVFTEDFEPGSLVRQPDGKIVAGGTGDHGRFALARYNPDGTLDDGSPSDTTPLDHFGNNGKMTMLVNGGTGYFLALSGSKLVLAGSVNTDTDIGVAVFNGDGFPDSGFGTGGLVKTSWADRGYHDTIPAGLAVEPGGRIVVSGRGEVISSGNVIKFYVILSRYLSGGALDATYAGAGRYSTGIDNAQPLNLALDANGRPVVAGERQVGAKDQPFLARFQGGDAPPPAQPLPPAGTAGTELPPPDPNFAPPYLYPLCYPDRPTPPPGGSLGVNAGNLVIGYYDTNTHFSSRMTFEVITHYPGDDPLPPASAGVGGPGQLSLGLSVNQLTGNNYFTSKQWHGLTYDKRYTYQVTASNQYGKAAWTQTCHFVTPRGPFLQSSNKDGALPPQERPLPPAVSAPVVPPRGRPGTGTGIVLPINPPGDGGDVGVTVVPAPPNAEPILCADGSPLINCADKVRARPVGEARAHPILARWVRKHLKAGRQKLVLRFNRKARRALGRRAHHGKAGVVVAITLRLPHNSDVLVQAYRLTIPLRTH
jgi:uncharacterized delta-60 repeat protein